MLALWRQSRFDYRYSRGALQQGELESALPRLEGRIASTQRTLDDLRRDMDSLASRRLAESRTIIARQLVDSTSRGPPGVGPVLWDRVVSTCFDGTLGSLRNARGVPGIGDQRAAAIYAWVSQAEASMRRMLETEFSGKREISERYDALTRTRKASAKSIEAEVQGLVGIQAHAEKALRSLRAVRPATFRKAYKGEPLAAQQVRDFLIGVYPPWEQPPAWYQSVVGFMAKEPATGVYGASPIPPVPLAFLLGRGTDGLLVIEVRARLEGRWVKLEDPLTLLSHALFSQVSGVRITVARDGVGPLLAISSLHPRKGAGGRLLAEPDPRILGYLRKQKCVQEGESSRSIQVLDGPPLPIAVVDFNPGEGLHIVTGYEIPGQAAPVPADQLRTTPDGRFIQVDGVFAPVPQPPGDAAAKWLKSPSRTLGMDAIPAFFRDGLRALQRDFGTVLTSDAKRIKIHERAQLKCEVSSLDPNWLALEISYEAGGHILPLSSVEQCVNGFVRVGDFEWTAVDTQTFNHLREGLRKLGAQPTPGGFRIDVATLARVEDLVGRAGGQMIAEDEVRRAVDISIASRVPPFLLPDLSAFLSRTVARSVQDWRNVPIREFAQMMEQMSLEAHWLPDHVPPDLRERIFLPFYPVVDAPNDGAIELKRPTREFLEECLVKLKRQLYGEEEAKLTFDPRIEGPHRQAFVASANYLEFVLGRVEMGMVRPYLCHVCGIYGEMDLLVLRRGDRPACLWCSRGLLLIAQRFRSLRGEPTPPS